MNKQSHAFIGLKLYNRHMMEMCKLAQQADLFQCHDLVKLDRVSHRNPPISLM